MCSVLLFDNMSTDSSSAVEIITITEAAKLLKVSVSTVRRLLDGRCIPFHKVGGSIRLTVDDLLSYLRQHRVESVG